MENPLVQSEEYQTLRGSVPLKRILVDVDEVWKVYDAGPQNIKCPIVCLPPAYGNAHVFFRQLVPLSTLGYRIISLDYPVFWTVEEFCTGLRKLLDHLHLNKVHLLGCSLGGFLASKFSEHIRYKQYVASLILCSTFTDTSVFKYVLASTSFWAFPHFLLKKIILNKLTTNCQLIDKDQSNATSFIVESINELSQRELASRLTLNFCGEYVRFPHRLQDIAVTVIDTFDEDSMPNYVKQGTYKCFPFAKQGHLKSGGQLAYLSRTNEVNLYLRIHLQQFENTELSASVK